MFRFLQALGLTTEESPDLESGPEEPVVPTTDESDDKRPIVRDKKGRTPIYTAVQSQNLPMLKDLLRRCRPKAAVLDIPDENGDNTPLHLAVQMGLVEYFDCLLQAGASVTSVNKSGMTPFHLAFKLKYIHGKGPLKHEPLNKELLAALGLHNLCNVGNLPSNIDETPISMALRHPDFESLDLKLKSALIANANLELIYLNDDTLLHIAVKNRALSAESFNLLLDRLKRFNEAFINVVLNAQDRTGYTALYRLIETKDSEERSEKIKALLALKPNLNEGSRATPLHLATEINDTNTAARLIQLRADVNKQSYCGLTALYHAASHGNITIIHALRTAGADFSGAEGERAITIALFNNHSDAVIQLIECGADPYVHLESGDELSSSSTCYKNKTEYRIQPGDTPLHFAVVSGNEALAAACLRVRPDMLNAVNSKGYSPAYLAIAVLNPVMAHFLFRKAKDTKQKIEVNIEVTKTIFLISETWYVNLVQKATKRNMDHAQFESFFQDSAYQLSHEQEETKKQKASRYRFMADKAGEHSQTVSEEDSLKAESSASGSQRLTRSSTS